MNDGGGDAHHVVMHDDERTIENIEERPVPPSAAPERMTNGAGEHLTRRHRSSSFYAVDHIAEQALLGALLHGADPNLVDLAAWTVAGAQAVHAAVLQLHDGKPLDLRLVARVVGNELDRLRIVDARGGEDYVGAAALVILDSQSPPTSSAQHFADIVNDQHRLRVLSIHVANAEQALLDADADQVLEHLDQARQAGTATTTATSWHAVDLAPILAGDDPPQPPTLLQRTDGTSLVYAGKVNAFNAESETAKSWLALWACAQEIDEGRDAIYIDFEDTAHTAVERLLGFNLEPDQIAEHFWYLRPDDPFDLAGQAAVEQLIERTAATIVVIDGVTEAMHLHGLSLLDNDDIARFYSLLPRRIANHGPGVIDIDHVPKDTTNRKGGIGGQHKRAGVDGAILLLEPSRPFGRGLHGVARIVVDKDRPGHVRAVSHEGKVAGELHLDATSGKPNLYVEPITADRSHLGTWDGPTQCMAAVEHWFAGNPEEISQRQVLVRLRAAGVSYRTEVIAEALERLVDQTVLSARIGPRNARLFRLATSTLSDQEVF